MSQHGERPKGQRFSFQYLDRPLNLRDGAKIRRRVAALFDDIGTYEQRGIEFSKFIEREAGVHVSWTGGAYGGPDWTKFFGSCELDTFLDCITLVAQRWTATRMPSHASRWIAQCERIFREEQAAYTVDDQGGVHPYVDAAFHLTRQQAIAALQGQRYVTAATSLNKAYDSLHGSPVQARDAIRHAFDAAETLFKTMTSKPRLTAADAKSILGPLVDRSLKHGDPVAQRASHQMLSSLADWVDAAHNYRHAPGEAEPPEPPEAVWHLLMTQAAGFVRWLAELDRALQSQTSK